MITAEQIKDAVLKIDPRFVFYGGRPSFGGESYFVVGIKMDDLDLTMEQFAGKWIKPVVNLLRR